MAKDAVLGSVAQGTADPPWVPPQFGQEAGLRALEKFSGLTNDHLRGNAPADTVFLASLASKFRSMGL